VILRLFQIVIAIIEKIILDDQIEIDSMHKQNMLAEKMTMGQNILNVSKILRKQMIY
jgi:hypothetical protein